jgi:hypothetical protein
MSESYLSLKQLVELVNIPENSCKRYILEHKEFIKFDKVHNQYRIHTSSVETIKSIRKLYWEGHKREAVDDYLRGSGVPVMVTVDSEDSGKSLVNINEEVQNLKNMFRVQQENMLQMQMQFNQKLAPQIEEEKKELKEAFHEEIGELKQLVNRHESERISALRSNLDEVSATVEVIKKVVEAERKKSFFQKIFGR